MCYAFVRHTYVGDAIGFRPAPCMCVYVSYVRWVHAIFVQRPVVNIKLGGLTKVSEGNIRANKERFRQPAKREGVGEGSDRGWRAMEKLFCRDKSRR